MSASINSGTLQFTDVTTTETDYGTGTIIPIDTLPPTLTASTFGSDPAYFGLSWTNFSAGVVGSAAGTAVSQVLTFNYNLSAGTGGVLLGFESLLVVDLLTGADASINASETINGQAYSWNVADTTPEWLANPTENATVTVQVTNAIAADVNGNANDLAIISGISQGFVSGSVSIVKEVSVDGGKTWLSIGSGATSDLAQALVGCPVEYQVVVTNNSSSGLTFSGSVSDVGITGISGFTFGGSSSLTLAAGSSETSGIVTVSATSGDVFDTATVTGVISDNNGHSGSVSASSSADVTGVNGSVSITKQISVDGGVTWINGDGNDPAALQGGTVEYRVILDNTGTVALDNVAVTDALVSGAGPVPTGFTFVTNDPAGTLAVGQVVTSDVASSVVGPTGITEDQATVTAKAVIQNGTSAGGAPVYTNSICNVTASDTAEYNSVSYNGPNSAIVVDKQVYMCGTWIEVGAFTNGANAPIVLANGSADVQFRVIVTNESSLGVTGLGVTDSYAGTTTNFVLPSTSLAVGASITSSTLGVIAQVGTDILDTANATGTVGTGGVTASVTASDTADYTGVTGSVTIDKQVSVNGGTSWQDVGNGVLNDPTITTGGSVEFRVLVTNTGGLAITNASVTDAYSGGSATFVFGSTSLSTTGIAVGTTVTSDVLSLTAASGHQFDTANVTGTISDSCGNTATVTSGDTADYTGVTVTPSGSISIDKQVSVDCGKTWEDVGRGVLQDPTASIGGMVEYRVVVTDTGSTGLSNITVGDVNGGAVTGFTFGGATTLGTLAVGQSVTSDAGLTPAQSGHLLDVATATGTVSGGGTTTVTSSDTADYTGVKGNITLDKQVSTNGTTWVDVGSGVLQDPSVMTGGTVYYRVIVTDTGTSTITGITVGDVGNGAPSGFTFGSKSGGVTLNAGQSITSNVAGVCALVGYNMDTATVTGTITSGGGMCGMGGTTTVVGACDVADYTGINGSITLDKQVSVNGGTTWQDVGNGVLQSPAALIGSSVEFRVIVTDTGTTAVTGVTVSDAGGGSVTGFTFGGSGTITLAAGQSVTSDLTGNTTPALCGENLDTATATGTVTVGGSTVKLTTTDVADYKGAAGGVSVDKEVSVDGGKTWQDVGNCSNDPLATVGSTVDFRVIVTDTGGTALTNVSVSDAGNSIKDFTFGGKTTVGTLAIGQSITSDIASTTAISGYQVDTADVTGTVTIGGSTATVSALSTADYTGTSGGGGCGGGWGGGGGCGGGWGGGGGCGGGSGGSSGGCGTGWGSGWYNGASNGYGCGSSSSGNLCNDYGNAQKIEFCYSASDCVSQQGLQSGLACVSGHDGCSTGYVEVTNCANPYQTGAQCYYSGTVSNGQDYFASCGSSSGFSGDCYIHVFSSAQAFNEHQAACQTDTYVANGSQSVCLGDQVGCSTVVGYVGHSGSWCV